ncbi:hypothetical protein TNCV_4615051 [Trichonephila clavipes]|nr:hypothetical protein TNCV_4615051 [Trichonephila clavipes]
MQSTGDGPRTLIHDQVMKATSEQASHFRNFYTVATRGVSTRSSNSLHGFCGCAFEQASNSIGVKTKNNNPHPPYFPDFAPCDFRIFPELARHFQSHRFQIADEIKSASQDDVKDMVKNGFQKCFDDLYKRW